MKRNHHRIKSGKARYTESYANGESMLDLAKKNRFSPYLLARFLVEELTQQGKAKSKKIVTQAFRDPMKHLSTINCIAPKYRSSETAGVFGQKK